MSDIGVPLGGIDDLASAVVSLPTLLAIFAIFFASMQGVLALESADPCRLSIRKMNLLLSLEFLEMVAILVSEILSFVELRQALQLRLQRLDWIAPCLFAAGLIEAAVDMYFTLAVVTKSRVGWMPVSAVGSSSSPWEVVPFLLTFALSMTLVGWRLRWWWTGVSVAEMEAVMVTEAETTLSSGVMGFAVGWAVGISSLVLIIIALTDAAEDGPSYIAGIRYLWKPDKWIDEQHNDVKVCYRKAENEEMLQQYVATAVLDGKLTLPESQRQISRLLERQPLHLGNAIVGHDQQHMVEEDRRAGRLHIVLLIAEHLIVLPLLIVVVTLVSRVHDTLDLESFNVLRQLTDAVIVIAFLEIALGIKNVIWSISGTSNKERTAPSESHRLQELRGFALDNYKPLPQIGDQEAPV